LWKRTIDNFFFAFYTKNNLLAIETIILILIYKFSLFYIAFTISTLKFLLETDFTTNLFFNNKNFIRIYIWTIHTFSVFFFKALLAKIFLKFHYIIYLMNDYFAFCAFYYILFKIIFFFYFIIICSTNIFLFVIFIWARSFAQKSSKGLCKNFLFKLFFRIYTFLLNFFLY